MKKSVIYAIWGVLYCLCVGLGFLPETTGFAKAILVGMGVLFFLPPFWLWWQAKKESNRKTFLILRLLSICSLGLSLILLVLNVLSVNFSAHTGLVLYVLLTMFSAPMICMQYWAVSLFLWACLLMLSLKPCRK